MGAHKDILVVDDEPAIVEMLVARLAQAGYDATSAPDAMQAVIQGAALKPRLIITDLMMGPFGSGADAYKAFRSNAVLADVPVIFLTAMAPPQARGIVPKDDPKTRLLFKPVNWALLEQAISELIGDTKSLGQ